MVANYPGSRKDYSGAALTIPPEILTTNLVLIVVTNSSFDNSQNCVTVIIKSGAIDISNITLRLSGNMENEIYLESCI